MKVHHEAWAIINDNGHICYNEYGEFSIYKSEQEAIKICSLYISKYPDRKFSIKKTQIYLYFMS